MRTGAQSLAIVASGFATPATSYLRSAERRPVGTQGNQDQFLKPESLSW